MVSLARTAYLVSCVSYLVFLFLEWLRPGFVSYVFSPHLFLAAAIVFGVLWGWKGDGGWKLEAGIRGKVVALIVGLLLAWVVWTMGRSLEEFRILVTLAAFLTPFTIYRLLSTK